MIRYNSTNLYNRVSLGQLKLALRNRYLNILQRYTVYVTQLILAKPFSAIVSKKTKD